jgi:ornithine cyclodeaminase
MVLVISETLARQLVSIEDALSTVEAVFAAMARGEARNYPVVRERVGHADAVFGVKTGADVSRPLLGLKAGGYWPGNMKNGVSNHQSATLVFDPETGRASGLVSANYLTGVRTGAASAIAVKHLARADASVLGMIGAGVLSVHQLRAIAKVRALSAVHAYDPSADQLKAFGAEVETLGLRFVPEKNAGQVAQAAEILITVTPSQKALVLKSDVRPGTHISAMGADTKGKQELDPQLVAGAAVFSDEIEQSLSIGECQHAFAAGLITRLSMRGTLGAVIAGLTEGRQRPDEITLFDGTGVALQDLVVAELALKRAREQGLGTEAEN